MSQIAIETLQDLDWRERDTMEHDTEQQAQERRDYYEHTN